MKYSIWQINDSNGNKLGLLKTESFLDNIDVNLRAKNRFGEDIQYPIYLGDVD